MGTVTLVPLHAKGQQKEYRLYSQYYIGFCTSRDTLMESIKKGCQAYMDILYSNMKDENGIIYLGRENDALKLHVGQRYCRKQGKEQGTAIL